jgi:Glycosyl transferase family 90
VSGSGKQSGSIATLSELEALLNGCPQVEAAGWCLALWPSLDERLHCSARRGRPRYVVRASTADDAGRADDPLAVFLRADRDLVEILLDPVYADVPPPLLYVLDRVFTTTLALECSLSYRDATEFEHAVCLSDLGHAGVPSFTGQDKLDRLLPDPQFLVTLAYGWFRSVVDRDWIPWNRREHRVIWRGQLNGSPESDDEGLLSTQRASLCAIARGLDHADMVDAKLTGVSPFLEQRYGDELPRVEHLFGARMAPEYYMRSRYLIDIDGWANSWSGLFQKLLTGSAVLKVASQKGFRQWYYDRLVPWVNYVPVRADFADLDDAIAFVLENDDRAREIGEAGRRLALSLNVESEIYGMAARL